MSLLHSLTHVESLHFGLVMVKMGKFSEGAKKFHSIVGVITVFNIEIQIQLAQFPQTLPLTNSHGYYSGNKGERTANRSHTVPTMPPFSLRNSATALLRESR
jgi:hypothetical protein